MNFLKALFAGLAMLIPPIDGDPQLVYRFRMANVFMLLSVTIILLGFIGLAYSLIPVKSLELATEPEVQDLRQDITSMKILMLDDQIYRLREQQCKTTGGERQAITQRLYGLADAYSQETRRPYQLPPCNEL